MRVLILSFPYASAAGGGERYAEQLVEGLYRKGFHFSLVSSSRALLDAFRRRKWDARPLWCGVEPVTKAAVLLMPFTVLFQLAIMLVVLTRFRLAGTRVVVCLSLTDKLVATPVARLLGMRVVWMEHLVPGRSLTMNPYRLHYAVLARLAKIVVVSEAVASGIVALGVPRKRIRVIPPGVTVPSQRATLDGPPIIGVVSRLSPEKNLSLLLQAFTRVPESTLEIFGDGPEREKLWALAEQLDISGRVRFRGRGEDAEHLYRHLSVLVVPSRKESFGIAALEAMSWGVPVVATRVEGVPELIKDGVTGLLVAPDDASALAAAIVRVLTDRALAARLGEAGRARAADFTLAKNLTAWESLLHD